MNLLSCPIVAPGPPASPVLACWGGFPSDPDSNRLTLERAGQFVKGGFSFELNKSLRVKRVVWQPSFVDRRIRDSLEYERFKNYIWQNPVKRFLVKSPGEYPYSSANPLFKLDPAPQRLKPVSLSRLPQT
jgi:hypothetical protein